MKPWDLSQEERKVKYQTTVTCLLGNLYADQEATVRTRHETRAGSKLEKEYAKVLKGGSQFWLHVGNCFFDLLLLLYAYSVARLGDPAPLLDCKLKCLCSAHGERFVPAHLWTEEIHTPLLNAGHSLGNSSPDWRPSHFIPHFISLSILPFDFSSSLPLSLCSIKEPGIQTPIRWLFWGASLPSSQSDGSLNKGSSLPQPLISQIYWPITWQGEWAWTG